MISLDGVKLPCGVGCRILWLQVWGSRLQVWVLSHVLALCLGAKEKDLVPNSFETSDSEICAAGSGIQAQEEGFVSLDHLAV